MLTCPHCGHKFHPLKTMREVLQKMPGRTLWTFKDFMRWGKYNTVSAATAMLTKLRRKGYVEVVDRASGVAGTPMLLSITPAGRSYRAGKVPCLDEVTPTVNAPEDAPMFSYVFSASMTGKPTLEHSCHSEEAAKNFARSLRKYGWKTSAIRKRNILAIVNEWRTQP